MLGLPSLDHDPLDLVEAHVVAAAVEKLYPTHRGWFAIARRPAQATDDIASISMVDCVLLCVKL
jgi:hypothetical protein